MRKRELKSVLVHDKGSNRVYLIQLHPDDFPDIIERLDTLVGEHDYTKIFAKVPARFAPAFLSEGYAMEAFIPNFFKGVEDVLFLVKYFDAERSRPDTSALQALQQVLSTPPSLCENTPDTTFSLRPLTPADIDSMIPVFRQVFASYPFPIFEPAFLLRSMEQEGTRYFGAYHRGQLIAISSAECNEKALNAEMTDFAVLPSYRGQRLALHLLAMMEKKLEQDGYLTFYTIARLKSLSMNKTFYNSGYHYSGTLNQNTQISGSIESMNVWYKTVKKNE